MVRDLLGEEFEVTDEEFKRMWSGSSTGFEDTLESGLKVRELLEIDARNLIA